MLLLVSGATAALRRFADPRLGCLIVPGARNLSKTLKVVPQRWAMDNGAYSHFDWEAFHRMLEQFQSDSGCLFVCAPDVVGDAGETLRRFRLWAPAIQAYGFPVALVAQDGLTVNATPWDQIDALFIGGTTEFKLGPQARTLAAYAKARGKWLHMGRVNTKQRFRYAASIGCDSIDGSSFSRWSATLLPVALRWLNEIDHQYDVSKDPATAGNLPGLHVAVQGGPAVLPCVSVAADEPRQAMVSASPFTGARHSDRATAGQGDSHTRNTMRADVSCRLLEIDFCVAPEAKILRSDLTWVRADAVQVDEELIAFDELSKGHDHGFRAARVLATRRLQRPRVRVTTTHGSTLVATEHPFLARKHKMVRRWVKAKDLRPGMQLAFLATPWEPDTSWDGGWLAGFFDGEGWVSSVHVGYGQNPGPVLARVQSLLTQRNHTFRESHGSSTAQCAITNGIREALRFLGTIRPTRLLPKGRQIWEGRRTWGKQSPICYVMGVEVLGEGPVVALETTTKTYISDGFFSHNSAIEAKLTGYLVRDPEFIRLAGLGIHGALASHILGRPYAPTAPDADLKAYFSEIKEAHFPIYDRSKRAVYGDLYGQTDYGMMKTFPESFPTLKIAKQYKQILHQMAPTVPAWQTQTRERAYRQNYLGGAGDHPFEYKHWFWDVIGYRAIPESVYRKRQKAREPVALIQGKCYAIVLGADSKRVIAFYPQSIAAGVLKEALLRLFDPDGPSWIGDAYFGRTPLRAPIHDSLLCEIPVRCWDRVVECILREMTKPVPELPLDWMTVADRDRLGFGSHLVIGVAAKAGRSWGSMENLKVAEHPRLVPEDELTFPIEEIDEDDFDSMRTVLQQFTAVV